MHNLKIVVFMKDTLGSVLSTWDDYDAWKELQRRRGQRRIQRQLQRQLRWLLQYEHSAELSNQSLSTNHLQWQQKHLGMTQRSTGYGLLQTHISLIRNW